MVVDEVSRNRQTGPFSHFLRHLRQVLGKAPSDDLRSASPRGGYVFDQVSSLVSRDLIRGGLFRRRRRGHVIPRPAVEVASTSRADFPMKRGCGMTEGVSFRRRGGKRRAESVPSTAAGVLPSKRRCVVAMSVGRDVSQSSAARIPQLGMPKAMLEGRPDFTLRSGLAIEEPCGRLVNRPAPGQIPRCEKSRLG